MKRQGLLWVLLLSLSVGCGGSQKKPESAEDIADDSSAVDESPPEEQQAEPAADETTSEESSEPKSELGDDLPPPIPEAWQPNHRDCDELAEVYEELLRKKELEKLDKRHLSDKQKKRALPGVEQAVKQGTANWLKACEGIIGTVQVRKRWVCASKAKDLDRFNGCMDGKFDSELPDE